MRFCQYRNYPIRNRKPEKKNNNNRVILFVIFNSEKYDVFYE